MSVRRCNSTGSATVNGSVLTFQAHTAASVHVDTPGIQMGISARVSAYNWKDLNTEFTEWPKKLTVYLIVCFFYLFIFRFQWMYTEEWGLLSHMREPQRWLQMHLSQKLPYLASQPEEVPASLKNRLCTVLFHSLLPHPPSHRSCDVFWRFFCFLFNYFILLRQLHCVLSFCAHWQEMDSHLCF